jgi:hypothetical protein
VSRHGPPTAERRLTRGTNPDDAANHLHTATDLDDGRAQGTTDPGRNGPRHALTGSDRQRLTELVEQARQQLRLDPSGVVTLADCSDPEDYDGEPEGSADGLAGVVERLVAHLEQPATGGEDVYLFRTPCRLDADGHEVFLLQLNADNVFPAAAYALAAAGVLQEVAAQYASDALTLLRERQVEA